MGMIWRGKRAVPGHTINYHAHSSSAKWFSMLLTHFADNSLQVVHHICIYNLIGYIVLEITFNSRVIATVTSLPRQVGL